MLKRVWKSALNTKLWNSNNSINILLICILWFLYLFNILHTKNKQNSKTYTSEVTIKFDTNSGFTASLISATYDKSQSVEVFGDSKKITYAGGKIIFDSSIVSTLTKIPIKY